MRLSILLPPRRTRAWDLALQAGVTCAVTKPASALSGLGQPYEPGMLAEIKGRFDDADIPLVGLEGDPFDLTNVKNGLPGRDRDFDRYRALLSAMADLGLKLLCYNFMPRPEGAAFDWSRTDRRVPLRGGSTATGFRLSDLPAGRPASFDVSALLDHYAAFVEAVVPDAERHGIRMALHPDDPPLPEVGGMPRLFGSVDAFDRAFALRPTRANAVTFCQANFRLMGADLEETVRHFGGRIAFVHMRDVIGTADDFTETWHDSGPTDMAAMVRAYRAAGLDVPVRDDHVPLLAGEAEPEMPGYGTTAHLFSLGYLRGLLDASEPATSQ